MNHESTSVRVSVASYPQQHARVVRYAGAAAFQTAARVFADTAAIIFGRTIASLALERWGKAVAQPLSNAPWGLAAGAGVLYMIYLAGGYRIAELMRAEKELERVCSAVAAAFLLITGLSFTVAKDTLPALLTWFALSAGVILAGRSGLRIAYGRLQRKGYARQSVVLIGSAAGLHALRQRLALQRQPAYDFVGLISAELDSQSAFEECSVRVLGDVEHWREIVQQSGACLVIVDWICPPALLCEIVRYCTANGIKVELCSSALEMAGLNLEVNHCAAALRISARPEWSRRLQDACKAVLDFIIGLVGSMATLLMAPVIWVIIRLEDGGPLFHRREYVACDSKVGYYLKFRTMVQNADEVLRNNPELWREFTANHKLKNDPRLLRSGALLRKFSIDEFPQFFSVLTGRLTFVGPRVISSTETERYGGSLQKRLSVKPGLTGYWQIMGRQKTTYEERIAMDMFYIDNWSIWLDLVIIAKTFSRFFVQEGAY